MHRIIRVTFLILAVIILTSILLVSTVSARRGQPCGQQPPRGDACEPVYP